MRHTILSSNLTLGGAGLSLLLATTSAVGCSPSDSTDGAGDSSTGGSDSGAGDDVTGQDNLVVSSDGTGSTGSDTPDNPDECATDTSKVELAPLDLGLLVDTSASMDYSDKWLKVSGAISIVTQSGRYEGIGMALQPFPIRLQCDEAGYAAPLVTMGTLPDVGELIRPALDAQGMSGGTPLVQALRGMGQYLATWAEAHPDRRTVLVLATDGMPDSTCQTSEPANSLENAVQAAKDLYEGNLYDGAPSIPVFVIGVGSELTGLNQIAAAGGSETATLVSTGADVEKQFISALDAIRQQAVACDYEIPDPEVGTLDYDLVNVTFTEDTTEESLVYVETADQCELATDGFGWYYDSVDSPTKVVLCDQACERVNASTAGQVDLVYGCERVEVVR